MNYRRWRHGAKFWFWVLALLAYSAAAAAGWLMIDTAAQRYRGLSRVELTTAHADPDLRGAGAAQVAAIYRVRSGMPFSTLSPGSTFQIVWPDGSAETVMIVSPTSSLGAEPVVGTQQDK
jgi:hypothetical protein